MERHAFVTSSKVCAPLEVEINLESNYLSTICPKAYKNLMNPHLIHGLSLADNNLIEFSNDIFNCLTALKWLDLSWNKLEEIKADLFNNLKSIKEIWLSNNKSL